MATIRKRGDKWQVQIRRKGQRPLSQSFCRRQEAHAWARQMEVKADKRELPEDPKALEGYTLGQLVERYRHTVSVRKRSGDYERIILSAFLRHPICSRRLSELSAADFAAYRDERLETIQPASAFRLAWQSTKLRAEILDLHFHDLRHEAISRFFEKGLTTPEVALISGHRDMRMLYRYAHPIRKNIFQKFDTFD